MGLVALVFGSMRVAQSGKSNSRIRPVLSQQNRYSAATLLLSAQNMGAIDRRGRLSNPAFLGAPGRNHLCVDLFCWANPPQWSFWNSGSFVRGIIIISYSVFSGSEILCFGGSAVRAQLVLYYQNSTITVATALDWLCTIRCVASLQPWARDRLPRRLKRLFSVKPHCVDQEDARHLGFGKCLHSPGLFAVAAHIFEASCIFSTSDNDRETGNRRDPKYAGAASFLSTTEREFLARITEVVRKYSASVDSMCLGDQCGIPLWIAPEKHQATAISHLEPVPVVSVAVYSDRHIQPSRTIPVSRSPFPDLHRALGFALWIEPQHSGATSCAAGSISAMHLWNCKPLLPSDLLPARLEGRLSQRYGVFGGECAPR